MKLRSRRLSKVCVFLPGQGSVKSGPELRDLRHCVDSACTHAMNKGVEKADENGVLTQLANAAIGP